MNMLIVIIGSFLSIPLFIHFAVYPKDPEKRMARWKKKNRLSPKTPLYNQRL